MAVRLRSAASQYIESGGSPVSTTPVVMAFAFKAYQNTADQVIASICVNSGSQARLQIVAEGVTAGDPIRVTAINSAGTSKSVTVGTFLPGRWMRAAGRWTTAFYKDAWIENAAATSHDDGFSADATGLNRVVGGARISSGSYGAYFDGEVADLVIVKPAAAQTMAATLIAYLRGLPWDRSPVAHQIVSGWPLERFAGLAFGSTDGRYRLTGTNGPIHADAPPPTWLRRRFPLMGQVDVSVDVAAGLFTLAGAGLGSAAGKSAAVAAGVFTLAGGAVTASVSGALATVVAGLFTLAGASLGAAAGAAVAVAAGVFALAGIALAASDGTAAGLWGRMRRRRGPLPRRFWHDPL